MSSIERNGHTWLPIDH